MSTSGLSQPHVCVIAYHLLLNQSFVFWILFHLIMHSSSEQMLTETLNIIKIQVDEEMFVGFVRSVRITRVTSAWVVPWEFGLGWCFNGREEG